MIHTIIKRYKSPATATFSTSYWLIVYFKTASKKKLNLLVEIAREMGVKTQPMRELSDEEMGLPGPKVSEEQLENWLSKDDGESFEIKEGFKMMKKELATKLVYTFTLT